MDVVTGLPASRRARRRRHDVAIRDDHAARFFDWFYREMSRGQSVGAAIRTARREAMAGDAAAVWASVVVVGDNTVSLAATREQQEGNASLTAVAAAASLAIAAALAVELGQAGRGVAEAIELTPMRSISDRCRPHTLRLASPLSR